MNETEILSGLFSPEPASVACPTFDFPGLQQSQPTPPLSTPPTPPVDQQPCSNEELTRQYSELESWHNAAKLEISRLQGQIDYFKGILQYAEKGLKIKLDESKRLQQENVELKVRNTQLAQKLQKSRSEASGHCSEEKIQRLQDQIRARDLVIDLLRKEESQKRENEMQKRIEEERGALEAQLGLSLSVSRLGSEHTPPAERPKMPIQRIKKPEPPRRTRGGGTRRPRKLTPPPTSSNKPRQESTKSNTPKVQSQSLASLDTQALAEKSSEEELQVDKEMNAALEELFDE